MKNQKRWGLFFFLSPVLLWLVLLIVLPQIDLLVMSFRLENDEGQMVWSLSNYLSFFEEPIYWLTFVRTAIYSILVTFLTFVIALPVAFYITKVVAPKFQGFLAGPTAAAVLGQRAGSGLRLDDFAAGKRRHQSFFDQSGDPGSARRNAL